MFLQTGVTPKLLYETSRDYLVLSNPKEKPYDIVLTNDTVLDRTYSFEFEYEDKIYKSIAHCIACCKLKFLGASQEMIDECYKNYEIQAPMTREFSFCDFETDLYTKYDNVMSLIPESIRTSWKERYVAVAVEVIMTALPQNSEVRKALMDTNIKVICELSGSIAWGVDCDDNFLRLAYPKHWGGENGYGQALMIARTLMK